MQHIKEQGHEAYISLILIYKKEVIQIDSIYHDIQLSFNSSDVKRTVIKQNSEDTHVLRIKLFDKKNIEMSINNNWTFNISALKGDKTHILNSNNITVADNTLQVTMTKQMLSAPGTERCELIIQDGNKILFTDTFLIYVEPNVQNGSFIESKDEYNSITDALTRIQTIEDNATETKARIDGVLDKINESLNNMGETIVSSVEVLSEEAPTNSLLGSFWLKEY